MSQVDLLPRYEDLLFTLPDGREIVVTLYKDGSPPRLMERANSDHGTGWGPPSFGEVIK